ncbi:MAG TPA: hypothetical protein VNT75_04805 [Symbiobacteriaceae bacterium]|nr:hypothetical protein [Symbiobacteriaceae bacterium]
MAKRRRYLTWPALRGADSDEFLKAQAERFAACPEAAAFSDEDAQDFMLVASMLDGCQPDDVLRMLRNAGVSPPIDIIYDCYRMARHFIRRWHEPGVRERFLTRSVTVPAKAIARLRRFRNPAEMHRTVERHGPVGAVAIYRTAHVADLIGDLRATFTPKEQITYQSTLLWAKVELHRLTTEGEPARIPSRWEQQKLVRRLHLRDVQLRTMRRARRHLRGERTALLSRLREIGVQEQPELRELADELETIRLTRAEAERNHQAALAEQSERCRETIARLESEVAAAEAGYQAALALRRNLLGWKGGIAHGNGVALPPSCR